MGWPTLPDGTVDWASVFEDEKTGFIALINQADSEEKLRECVLVVISHLFLRDSDAPFRQQYVKGLDALFQNNGGAADFLITLKGRLRILLRQMKQERMSRALAAARKKQGTATAADERRLAQDDDPTAALAVL